MVEQTKRISSVVEYLDSINTHCEWIINAVFRGQPVRRNLLPAVVRGDPYKNTTQKEKQTLKQLNLLGSSFLDAGGATQLDQLVYAQHFGLKTRLLDWTTNPLAALWFALSSVPQDKDYYVYLLDADLHMLEDPYSIDPFASANTVVFQPRFNNPRIIAQHGWFSLHKFSSSAKKFIALEDNRLIKPHLYEFVINHKRRKSLLDDLDRYGISYKTLFPDLKGLCDYLNWRSAN